jgi:hypothetical protein
MRRATSILFFALGGFMLLGETMLAFVGGELAEHRLAMVGIFGGLALVPLLLGVWASPGRRVRELGLAILLAAGWSAFTIGTMAYMIVMPDTRHLFPPDLLGNFDGYGFGVLNLAVVGLLGWWLFRRGGVPAPACETLD